MRTTYRARHDVRAGDGVSTRSGYWRGVTDIDHSLAGYPHVLHGTSRCAKGKVANNSYTSPQGTTTVLISTVLL